MIKRNIRNFSEKVRFSLNGKNVEFPSFWLLDNDNYMTETVQRQFPTFEKWGRELPKVHSIDDNDESVKIRWSDGTTRVFEKLLLSQLSNPISKHGLVNPIHELWDRNSAPNPEPADYEKLLSEETREGERRKVFTNLLKHGFAYISGTPAEHEATVRACRALTVTQPNCFGEDWSFTADLAKPDTAYTNIAIGLHTDATYYNQPMGIQVFHVLEHEGEGGETMLGDGYKAIELLNKESPESVEYLSNYQLMHEYIDKSTPGSHVRSIGTVISRNPITKEIFRLRFNNHDRCPIPVADMDELYHHYTKLGKIIESGEINFQRRLPPGTVLLVDNFRVMHGRTAFTGKRRVSGIYLTRDDWISGARKHALIQPYFI